MWNAWLAGVLALGVFGALPAGAVLIASETFESDGDGTRYTLDGPGGFGTDNFFGLSTQGILQPSFLGFEGSIFLAGRDMNDFSGGTPNPRAFELDPVDLTGFSGVAITLGLAAAPANWELGQDDFVRIFAVDGDGVLATVQLDSFDPNQASNSDLLNATPVALGFAFQDFSYAAPAGITNLVLRIELYSTGDAESIGIDDIRIEGTPVPEPGVALLLALAALGRAVRRRA